MSTEQAHPARVPETAPPSPPSRLTRTLLTYGVIGPPLFVVVFLIEGATRPDYNPLRHLGLPIACLVVAYRFAKAGHRGWAGYCVGAAAAFLAGFALTSRGFAQSPTFMPIGGLLQRLTIIIGWAWLTALALYLLRGRPDPRRGGRMVPSE
jgi:hypothetical protein